MKSRYTDADRLQHMLKRTNRVLAEYARLGNLRLIKDELAFDGITYLIGVIGRAAHKVTPSFRSQHPGFPWRQTAKMRHFILDMNVDDEVIVPIIERDLPALRHQLQTITASLPA